MYKTNTFGLMYEATPLTTNKEDHGTPQKRTDGSQPPQEDESLRQLQMQMFDVANRIAIMKNEIAEAKEKESRRRERRHRKHKSKKSNLAILVAAGILLVAVTIFGVWRFMEMA